MTPKPCMVHNNRFLQLSPMEYDKPRLVFSDPLGFPTEMVMVSMSRKVGFCNADRCNRKTVVLFLHLILENSVALDSYTPSFFPNQLNTGGHRENHWASETQNQLIQSNSSRINPKSKILFETGENMETYYTRV